MNIKFIFSSSNLHDLYPSKDNREDVFPLSDSEDNKETFKGKKKRLEKIKESSKREYFIKISSLKYVLVPGLIRSILDQKWETVKHFFTYSNLLELLGENISIHDTKEKVGSYSNKDVVFKISASSEEEVKKLIKEMVDSEGAVCPFTYALTGKGENDEFYKETEDGLRKTGKKLSEGGSLEGYQTYLNLNKEKKEVQEKFRCNF